MKRNTQLLSVTTHAHNTSKGERVEVNVKAQTSTFQRIMKYLLIRNGLQYKQGGDILRPRLAESTFWSSTNIQRVETKIGGKVHFHQIQIFDVLRPRLGDKYNNFDELQEIYVHHRKLKQITSPRLYTYFNTRMVRYETIVWLKFVFW